MIRTKNVDCQSKDKDMMMICPNHKVCSVCGHSEKHKKTIMCRVACPASGDICVPFTISKLQIVREFKGGKSMVQLQTENNLPSREDIEKIIRDFMKRKRGKK